MKCRLCLFDYDSDENALRLFNENEDANDWTKLIVKYLLLEVKADDPYSTTICRICLNHLEDFHKFFQHIAERQKLLHMQLKEIMVEPSTEEPLLDVKDLILETEISLENPLSPATCIQNSLENDNNGECRRLSKHTSKLDMQSSTRTAQKCKIKSKSKIHSMESNKTELVDDKVEERKNQKQIQTPEEEKLGDDLIAKYIEMKCEHCDAQMDTFKNLKYHTRKEHKTEGVVTCCGKRFRMRCLLLDHLQFHLNPNNFKCDICNKVLKSKKLLELHKVNIHSDRQELKHECTLCHKRFACMNSHMLVHSKERNHKCEICGKGFKSENFLKVHMNTHIETKPFICDTCGREYRNKMSFERHIKDHEGRLNEPTDECSICGKWFTLDGLQRHMKCHKLEEMECKLCGKIVKSKNALRGHMDYAHLRQQVWTCSFCKKTFKRHSVFKEHIAMHTGQKDFRCVHCSREFRSKANMYAHIKKNHKKEWTEAQLVRFRAPLQS